MQGDLNSNVVIGVWGERESNSDHRSGQLHGESFDWDMRDKVTDKYMEKEEKEVQTRRATL